MAAFEQVAGGRFGDDQAMALRFRHDVHDGERLVVLIKLYGRNFAADDLGENVAVVVARHLCPPKD